MSITLNINWKKIEKKNFEDYGMLSTKNRKMKKFK